MSQRCYGLLSFLVLLNIILLNDGFKHQSDKTVTMLNNHTNISTRTKKGSGGTTPVSYFEETTELIFYETKGITKLRDKSRFLVTYHVVTCDGYILDVFRMKSKTLHPTQKRPVLLFHGMMQSSDRFVEQGKESSVAVKLQDLGYDVWLGNSRGNKYGRLHLYLEPDMYGEKYRFFNYSYEEIGLNDLSATVDFILTAAEADKLHYIGHAQGGTAFLVLNTLMPKYNAKFDTAHLLAPLGYQKHFSNSELDSLVDVSDGVYEMLVNLGVLEVFPYNTTGDPPYESSDYCFGDKKYHDVCNKIEIGKLMGLNKEKFDKFDTRGGAIKQLAHYAQNVRSKTFRRWDYGIEKNKLTYGTNEPPKFDLKLITVKTTMYYSVDDELVDSRDVLEMARDMPNARARKVKRRNFKHSDFINASDLVSCVYRHVFEEIKDWDGAIIENEPNSSIKLSPSLMLYTLPIIALKKLNKI